MRLVRRKKNHDCSVYPLRPVACPPLGRVRPEKDRCRMEGATPLVRQTRQRVGSWRRVADVSLALGDQGRRLQEDDHEPWQH